jgi:CRISPR-associated protein Cmr6
MTNQALPQKSRQFAENNSDRCQNLGLLLDKLAPWKQDGRGQWDLSILNTVRKQGQNKILPLSGGEAKGLWLSTTRKALQGETPSLFENQRTDIDLMRHKQYRWENLVKDTNGLAFSLRTAERLAVGLGASHVLETGLTLDRNTGLPYIPGSTLKGIARAWGLIEVAAQLGIKLVDKEDNKTDSDNEITLNKLSEELLKDTVSVTVTSDAQSDYINYFRFIFGWQGEAGAVSFLDGIYGGQDAPRYATDVMTPHYPKYYGGNGDKLPSEDDNPNPVAFLTVARNQVFNFGIVPISNDPRLEIGISTAKDWLIEGLVRLGAGSKTAAGYGFFNRKSCKSLIDL